MRLMTLFLFAGAVLADSPGVILSFHAASDFELTADPDAKPWRGIKGVFMDSGRQSEPVPGHRTEIRSRWTKQNLYFLFVCPYEALYLRPDFSTTTETNRLWQWDVAEVFVGADFRHIRQYKEFQVSPQGEWVDLDIDRDNPKPEGGWLWNAEGYKVKARIDAGKKIWYGEMRIPLRAIDTRVPKKGLEMRLNFYRIQGPPPDRKFLAWQPTGSPNNHVPEAFGRLRLE